MCQHRRSIRLGLHVAETFWGPGPLHSCGPKWIPVRSSRMAKLGCEPQEGLRVRRNVYCSMNRFDFLPSCPGEIMVPLFRALKEQPDRRRILHLLPSKSEFLLTCLNLLSHEFRSIEPSSAMYGLYGASCAHCVKRDA